MAEPATLVTLLDRAGGDGAVPLRFLDGQERESATTWREVRSRALEVASGLVEIGVRRGDRVALVFGTSAEFVHAYFGVLLAGAVPAPLYPPARLGQLAEYHQRTARMIQAAGARLVLASGLVARILGATVRMAAPPLGCRRLDDLPTSAAFRLADVAEEDLGLVQFSSGTTVDPKPVALTHRAIVAQVRLLNAHWPDEDGVRHSGVTWLPLYHDMGLIGCLFLALERPGPLTLIPPELFVARPARWLRAISRYRATLSVAPNFAYALCARKIRDEELDGVDLSCWRVALNGAETVVPSVARAFEQRFARWGFSARAITPVYGLSEAALAVTFSDPWSDWRSRRFDRRSLSASGRAQEAPDGNEITSVGRPLRGFDLRIAAPEGEPLPEGRVGRILVRGPSLMDSYLGLPEATAQVLEGGFLDTGDLGFVLDGELFVTGRAKDVLVINGANHAPEEVERAACTVRGARPGCAVAVGHMPEGGDGEELLVFLETARDARTEDVTGLPTRVTRAVVAATGLCPSQIVVLPPGSLPRTSSGKLRRRAALRNHLAGELGPPRPVTPTLLAGALISSSLEYAHFRLARAREPRE